MGLKTICFPHVESVTLFHCRQKYLRCVTDDVCYEPHGWFWWEDVCVADHELLQYVILYGTCQLLQFTTLEYYRQYKMFNNISIFFHPHQSLKEAYSNLCMKIHLTSKLTQYLANIFKMRFLKRNCIKYAKQCQNGIFEKTCRATMLP